MILKINPINPQQRLIDKVAGILKQGGLIAYPTDTYYGIGCDIMNKKGIEKIYQLKQRRKDKPFSFICSGLKNISEYAKVSNYAYKTMKRLLPGPYTFVLGGSKLVPKIMLAKRKTVGIRVPDHQICIALMEAMGRPIISTSATLGDRGVLHDPSFIDDQFGHALEVVIDGGAVPDEPSSIISLIDDVPVVIRKGLGDVGIFE
ncbi:MAG: threonylcarbamoyl-AMP synthase [Desulfobacteraceae bacterium]|nr:threonylcarbamoyl-AMP synthase [Desulfobacteraceae bacterium]